MSTRDRLAPLTRPRAPPSVPLAQDGRDTPWGHAVTVQPHGRPSVAVPGLGWGERPASSPRSVLAGSRSTPGAGRVTGAGGRPGRAHIAVFRSVKGCWPGVVPA